jgi:hypothetical protein
MRPSFPRLIRIIPKANITPATESIPSPFKLTSEPIIVPPPLTPREEAPTRVTLIQTLLKRRADALAKEEKGELAKGEGWPVNLKIITAITKETLEKVADKDVRVKLRDIMKET